MPKERRCKSWSHVYYVMHAMVDTSCTKQIHIHSPQLVITTGHYLPHIITSEMHSIVGGINEGEFLIGKFMAYIVYNGKENSLCYNISIHVAHIIAILNWPTGSGHSWPVHEPFKFSMSLEYNKFYMYIHGRSMYILVCMCMHMNRMVS